MPYGSPLRQRDGPLPRCTAVLRRASRGLQRAAGLRVCAHANAPRARSLSGGGAARALAACARRAALVGVGPCPMEAHCASETALSLGARPCSDVPAAASNEQPAFACAHSRTRHARALSREEAQHARLRRARAAPRWLESVHALWKPTAPARRPSPSVHGRAPTCQPRPPTSSRRSRVRTANAPRARSLSGGGAARALAACARRAALVGVGPCPMEAHCASETALSLGARPCSDVPAAASNEQLACACAHSERATARSLSREEAQHARLRRARAAPRWLESVHALWKPTAPARRPSPSVHGRAPTCQPRPPTSSWLARVRKRTRHRALSLSGGGAARALAACARRAALVGVGPCPMEAHCASETALSLGARPCSDVPAAASNEQPAFACAHTRTRHRALSLWEEAQHARLRRARAAPRWLESVHALWKPTAPARRPSPSVHGRAPTCQPRPPTSSWLAHVRKQTRHRARSLSGGGAARALAACARRAALVGVGSCPMEAHCASETALSLGARPCSDVPAAASNEQLACACAHSERATARSLSREEAQHARLRRARAAPRWLESVHALWKPTAPARRPSPSVHGRAPTCQPRPPTSSWLRVCAQRTRHRALSLSGGGAARALAACARRAALVGVGPCPMEAHCASETALSLGARPCSDVPAAASNEQPASRVRTANAPRARSLSGGGAARALAACARRAALVGVGPCPMEAHCASETALSSVHGRAPTCQPRPPTSSWLARVRTRNAPPRALSREEAQHARLRRARAAPRWLESVHALWKPTAPARRPSPSVHGRAPTCQPRPPTSSRRSRVRTANAPPRALSLGGGAARALAACARRAALVGVGPCPMEAHCASETALSLGARPCSDVPAAASNEQLACACAQANAPPRALSLSGGGAARALAACARRAALVGVGPCPMEAHCASETALSLGARPCSDVPAAASNEQLACACAHSERATALALSREEAQHARLRRARAAPRWLESVHALWKPTAPARRPSPSVHGRAPTCQPRPPTSSWLARVRKRTRHRALSLREEAQHARLRRARAAPRWLESVHALWKPTAPARRPSPSVHGRAPTCQPRPPTSSRRCACAHSERATARSLSREEAQHARLRRARAAPRWLESVHALWKPTAPARRPSPSVHGRAPTCQPRPPTSSRLARVRTRERATARSLSGGGAARALAACARRAALVGVGPCPMEAHCASETALSLGARPCSDVPAAASNEQPACACAHSERATARALSREEAQHARLRRARAAPRWLESVHALWKPTAPARRPSPSVHGRAPTCQPRPPTSSWLAHVRKQTRHRARSLSREEAQHARLRRVRAAPRWLESVHALWKPTAPARRPSPSVHGRAPTCQPRPPTSSRRSRVRTRERATARSLSGGGAARALAACARRAALVGVGPCPMEAHCASETALSLGARPCSDVPAFSDPDKALGQSAAPRWFLSVSVLSNSLYFTRGPLGPSRARSTGRASVVLVSGWLRATEPFPLL